MTIFLDYNKGKLGIIYSKSGEHFAKKVVKELDAIISESKKSSEQDARLVRTTKSTIFQNKELKTEIEECIRNQDIYIFQDVENHSEGLSVNDNFMELKTAIYAAKLSNAHTITAVIPVFPYARQDKAKSREGINAAMVARELEDAGASRVMTLDIHNEAIAGFFRNANLENLRASKSLIDYVHKHFETEKLMVVAPDTGGADRANFFARKLGTKLAMIYKERDYSTANTIENMSLIGNVNGKDVYVVDDMIDTAGTVVNAAKKLKDKGANKIYFGASLTLFSGPAIERLDKAHEEGYIDKVVGTNVIFKPEDFKTQHPWYDEVNLERYFARVIYNINKGKSISKLLE